MKFWFILFCCDAKTEKHLNVIQAMKQSQKLLGEAKTA
jgi:hypothetical protein